MNRLNDAFFKQLLGNEKRKRFTLSFLNSVLQRDGENAFVDVTFIDKDNEPEYVTDKLTRLDILAKMNDGTIVNIEVQVANFQYMIERSLFYWSKAYIRQMTQKATYRDLKQTIAINLLNYRQLKNKDDWHNDYALLHTRDHDLLTNKLEIHFLELPKLKLSNLRELKGSKAWGAYFSGKCNKEEMEAICMGMPILKDVLDYEHEFMSDAGQRYAYEMRQKALIDYNTQMQDYWEAGMEHGITKGKAEGAETKQNEMVQKLLKAHVDIDIIAQAANLTVEQVVAIGKSN